MPKKANPEVVAEATPEVVPDIWDQMVPVKIPKDRNIKEDVVVSVNDKSYMIKRGEWVDVPRPVADALEDQMRAQEARDAYIEENASA